jgi:beta-keto acid cleavage enzyme
MSDKTVITCALNGVLTDPKQHPVPVTLEEMAREAKSAFNAGGKRDAYPFTPAGAGQRQRSGIAADLSMCS